MAKILLNQKRISLSKISKIVYISFIFDIENLVQ